VRHVHAHFLEEKQNQRHSFGLNKVIKRVVAATGVSQRFAEDCMELDNDEYDISDADMPPVDDDVYSDAEDDDESAFSLDF
jgi:hypothetical protein